VKICYHHPNKNYLISQIYIQDSFSLILAFFEIKKNRDRKIIAAYKLLRFKSC